MPQSGRSVPTMNAAREHRVPLSDRTLAVLDEARRELPRTQSRVPVGEGPHAGLPSDGEDGEGMEIGAVPHGFGPAFATGPPSTPGRRGGSANLRWRTSTATASRPRRRSDLFERCRVLNAAMGRLHGRNGLRGFDNSHRQSPSAASWAGI